jgi:cell fate regulator YaaT (PSP1 superfamily)
MDILYRVMIDQAITLDCVGAESLNLHINDWCIVNCGRYQDYGRVTHLGDLPADANIGDMPVVDRRATLRDQGKANENAARGKSFSRKGQEVIDRHKLPMKLASTHYVFDRSLIIFMFTAPGRVDFRELVKDMTKSFGSRVELRQIGPRDQAAIIGGLGSCGRVLCCSSFLTNFVSINLKMAKEQGVSLNPSNIIGACGRLKCCLDYEYEGYKILMENMPRPGSRCTCEGCDGHIIEGNPLTQTVKVSIKDNNGSRIVSVPLAEVELKT